MNAVGVWCLEGILGRCEKLLLEGTEQKRQGSLQAGMEEEWNKPRLVCSQAFENSRQIQSSWQS